MAHNNMENTGVSWTLLDGRLTMGVIPCEKGDLRVRFRDEDDDILWSSNFERGFWESRTKKGEIGNRLADNTIFAKATVKQEINAVWTDFFENAEKYESRLISRSAEDLIRNTQAVEVHPGKRPEWHVYLNTQPTSEYAGSESSDGGASVRKLVFSNKEWVRSYGNTQTPPIVSKYNNAFYKTLKISWWEWREYIRPRWAEMQQFVPDD